MVTIAINGFGRIGRTAFRILSARPNVQVVAINDLADAPTMAHLLRYDSTYGIFGKTVEANDQGLVVDGKLTKTFAQKDAAQLPWKELNVDVVIECTGKYTERNQAQAHITAGAKSVVISAPGKGDNPPKLYVRGVNDETFVNDTIVSNASCTTNCLAPVMAVLESTFGVESALMTTVHAYTADQQLQDGAHKDLRRARAAATNIVPTTTGAAKSVGAAIPSLNGIFDGVSLRVPVACGSIADVTAVLKEAVTVEKLNDAFIQATNDPRWQGILMATDEPIVSSDIIGSSYSAIVDLGLTKAVGNLVKVFAWYDNEFGYTSRLVEMAEEVATHLS